MQPRHSALARLASTRHAARRDHSPKGVADMITESDVRAVLTEQAHDISEPDDILARITFEHRPGRRRSPGQRHWIAPVAAAAVAAVVAGAVALTSVNHRTQNRTEQAASHTLPPMGGIELRFIGAMGRVPNYQIGQPVFAV